LCNHLSKKVEVNGYRPDSGWRGLFATIAGVLAEGAVMARIGINRSLWVFGVLQAASNFAYMPLAYAGRQYDVMFYCAN
jgi:PAT family beta-lactamase induction signal transducer AmpG